MILAACVLQLFTSRQNHRAQLDAAVRRARHLPRRLGGAQERRAARSPACASAGAARRPDSAADRKVRRRVAVKPVHAGARWRTGQAVQRTNTSYTAFKVVWYQTSAAPVRFYAYGARHEPES